MLPTRIVSATVCVFAKHFYETVSIVTLSSSSSVQISFITS